jgi:cobalt/nickel transport protein
LINVKLWIIIGTIGLLGEAPALAQLQTFCPTVGQGYGKVGENITWKYFWGHPFEMVILDAQPPKFFLVSPEGKKDDLITKDIKLKDEKSGSEKQAYEVTYLPQVGGDYYLCLAAPPYFIEAEGLFWQDYVKQPLHVAMEKGWDRPTQMDVEIIPLTRPYGLQEGAVFKGRAQYKGKPLREALVEIEKFNGFFIPEDKLPKDHWGQVNRPLITPKVKTDAFGYLDITLNSPGWWIISVAHPDGRLPRDNREFPVIKRGGLWIYVHKHLRSAKPGE